MSLRQLPAAIVRSLPLSSTCASFSASAIVEGEISGPTAGAVPNAGGAPGGRLGDVCALVPREGAAPRRPSDVWVKNCLRDFDTSPPNLHCRLGRAGLRPPWYRFNRQSGQSWQEFRTWAPYCLYLLDLEIY